MFNPNIIPAFDNAKPLKRQTIAEQTRQFGAKVDRRFALVIGTDDSIDTVAVSNPDPISDRILAALKKLNPGEVHHTAGKWKRWRYRGRDFEYWQQPYLRLHQPSPATYAFLMKYLPNHRVVRVDIAIDYFTATQADADLVLELLVKHAVMPGRRADWETEDYQGTIYFRRHGVADQAPQTGRDIVAYDKPGNGGPAAHVDFRFFGKTACERLGVYQVADLINLDRRDRIRKSFHLAIVHWDRAAILFEQEAQEYARRHRQSAQRSRRPVWPSFTVRGMRHRLEYRIASQLIAGDEDADLPNLDDFKNYPVQDVLDAAPFLRKGKAAITLPAERIVPNQAHSYLVSTKVGVSPANARETIKKTCKQHPASQRTIKTAI